MMGMMNESERPGRTEASSVSSLGMTRRRNSVSISLAFAASIVMVSNTLASQIASKEIEPTNTQIYQTVSIISLISNPRDYDGKLVRVGGFAILQFEGNAISIDIDTADNTTGASLWLEKTETQDFSPSEKKRYHRRYVNVEGTFDADFHGHMGEFPGSIRNIQEIRLRMTKNRLDSILARERMLYWSARISPWIVAVTICWSIWAYFRRRKSGHR